MRYKKEKESEVKVKECRLRVINGSVFDRMGKRRRRSVADSYNMSRN